MSEQIPTESQEFRWEQPPRIVEVSRLNALKMAVYVTATLRSASGDIIEDWQLAIAQLVEHSSDSRSGLSLAEQVARHNRRALKLRERQGEANSTPSDSPAKKLGDASIKFVLKPRT